MSSSNISGASAYSNFKSLYADQIKKADTPGVDYSSNNSIQSDPTQNSSVQNSFSASSASNDDASEAPKPVLAPLPPGQGTRIDQLV